MSTPERSKAIARSLAADADSLPENFAVRVASLAESRAASRAGAWNAVVMLGAYAAMIGVCVAGWSVFGEPTFDSTAWLEPILRTAASQPWPYIPVAGFAIVQMLTFRRRARTAGYH